MSNVLTDFDHILSSANDTPGQEYQGAWCTVEIQPDIFVPQRFTVGVVIQAFSDRMHFKILDDARKFQCVYGKDEFPRKSVQSLLSYAEETLKVAAHKQTKISEIIFGNSALSISTPKFTSGANAGATVERLFSEVVVMAKQSTSVRSFVPIDQNQARTLIHGELKVIAPKQYSKIVVENPKGIPLFGTEGAHFLNLNLLAGRNCGSVTSAVYKSAQSVERNLLLSSRDLTTYARVKNDVESSGLFLLLPDQKSLPEKEYKRIEEVIEEHEWKLEKDGFKVISHASPAVLAAEVYEWAKPQLAA